MAFYPPRIGSVCRSQRRERSPRAASVCSLQKAPRHAREYDRGPRRGCYRCCASKPTAPGVTWNRAKTRLHTMSPRVSCRRRQKRFHPPVAVGLGQGGGSALGGKYFNKRDQGWSRDYFGFGRGVGAVVG